MKIKTLFNIFLVIAALGLALLAFRSIMRPEKFKLVYNQRHEEIKTRLITVRAIQAIYRNEFKKYAENMDELVAFVNEGNVHIEKMSGEIPEGMNELDAFKKGLIKKTVETVPAKEKIMESDPNLTEENFKNFALIPESGGKKFEIQLGKLSSKTYEIPVYRVDVSVDDVLVNMEKTITSTNSSGFAKLLDRVLYNNLAAENQYKILYKPMWLGSLNDASTSGSWE